MQLEFFLRYCSLDCKCLALHCIAAWMHYNMIVFCVCSKPRHIQCRYLVVALQESFGIKFFRPTYMNLCEVQLIRWHVKSDSKPQPTLSRASANILACNGFRRTTLICPNGK